ncbi:Cullin-3 [Neolecta irregularis DAH-3]|uniref:Cullin-3 n=1 Tax=Neolecta irregularis (strain DAH-3) TaxID=1198029 RepID=A0A1U7LIY5_NEOID|nr:Cullin-3 [Neolecta irregularis DAH-3]|eukprot:OLL22620.1 Cullin-3 [Neolecta irregularis DAH-3]
MATRGVKPKIKPPKKTGLANNFDESWHILSQAIQQIFRKNASTLSFEHLYRNSYNLVLHKQGQKLYDSVQEVVANHLNDVAETVLSPAAAAIPESAGSTTLQRRDTGTDFMKTIKSIWEDHAVCMSMVASVFMYLDRTYVKQNNLPQVYDASLNTFRDIIIRSKTRQTGDLLSQIILEHIRMERDGDEIDRSLIKVCTDMLSYLSSDIPNCDTIYQSDFEPLFLSTSGVFYSIEAATLIAEYSASAYLQHVERRLREEKQRTQHYITATSEPKIRAIVEQQLIGRHMQTIMEMEGSGLAPMLDNDHMGDLNRMYTLFLRSDSGLNGFKAFLLQRIVELGKSVNFQALPPPNRDRSSKHAVEKIRGTQLALKWVKEVIQLKDKYDKIWREAFEGDKTVQNTITDAFSHFINQNEKSAEFISLFIDENLKKGLKGKTEQETEDVLDKTITLFRFLSDKDLFEGYYKNHLAKRLLTGRSVSDDAERGMIAKLKMEVGHNFTQKLEGMLRDMKTSNDMAQDYKNHVERKNAKRAFEFTANVLTSTHWPFSLAPEKVSTCAYPREAETSRKLFQDFYLNRFSGRQLVWLPTMGNCDLRFRTTKRIHELNVSTFAMTVLMLFNDIPEDQAMTFEELKTATSMNDLDLSRTLQSLACARFKILMKSSSGPDVSHNDSFSLNVNFTHDTLRVRIATIAANKVEDDSERKETLEKIEEMRKHLTDAAIIRVMKDRKTLSHNDLVVEVTKQLVQRFVPSPVNIKKRIEALIDREYLERTEKERNTYNYLA